MLKKNKGKIILGAFLVSISIVLHIGHYLIFRDLHHLMIFLVADIAFVPMEVFLVSLVFEHLVEVQKANDNKRKVYMLVEVFYMELGNELLLRMSNADKEIQEIVAKLQPNMEWDKEQFITMKKVLSKLKYQVNIEAIDLCEVYEMMKSSKNMMISMITNPALTEHASFSDSILATFHLYDEMNSRTLESLSEDDLIHLKVDLERAYEGIAKEWVQYMEHLSSEYPYLYYTAIQENPFVVS